jgi:hypothetical protein
LLSDLKGCRGRNIRCNSPIESNKAINPESNVDSVRSLIWRFEHEEFFEVTLSIRIFVEYRFDQRLSESSICSFKAINPAGRYLTIPQRDHQAIELHASVLPSKSKIWRKATLYSCWLLSPEYCDSQQQSSSDPSPFARSFKRGLVESLRVRDRESSQMKDTACQRDIRNASAVRPEAVPRAHAPCVHRVDTAWDSSRVRSESAHATCAAILRPRARFPPVARRGQRVRARNLPRV